MEVEDKAWEGLKETAGVSTQARHHVGSVCPPPRPFNLNIQIFVLWNILIFVLFY